MKELPPEIANKAVTHGELFELFGPMEDAIVKLTSAALDLAVVHRNHSGDEQIQALGESAFEELKRVIELLKTYGDTKGRILLEAGAQKIE